MGASFWLRLAAVLGFVQIALHAWLFLNARPGGAEGEVVAFMRDHAFAVGANARTYWDCYFGYGLMIIATGAVQAALYWLLAKPMARDPAGLRPVVGLYVLAVLVHVALAWRFFFPLPALFDLVVAAMLALAYIRSLAKPAAA